MLSVGAGRNVGDRNIEDSGMPRSSRSLTNETITTTGHAVSAVVRQGRGGAGNYKRKNPSSPTSTEDSGRGGSAGGYVIRDPKTPMLLSFNNPLPSQTDRLNDQRQCDRTWNRFMLSSAMKDEAIRQHYMRISPEFLAKLPKFDEVQKLDSIERETAEVLRQNYQEIIEAAHRLVASTFFFEKDVSGVKQGSSGYSCTGMLSCPHFCTSDPGHIIPSSTLSLIILS